MRVRLYLFLFFLFCVAFSQAQEKYALIVSKIPTTTGPDKRVAKQNFNRIIHALKVQGFADQNILFDTTQLSRKALAAGFHALLGKVKKGDFSFFYFDLDVTADSAGQCHFVLGKQPGESINAAELGLLFALVADKSGGDTCLFPFFQLKGDDCEPRPFTRYALAISPSHQRGALWVAADDFTNAVAYALTSETSHLSTYSNLFQVIKVQMLLNSSLRPVFEGYGNLFNGKFKKLPVHFLVTSSPDDSTVIINAGQNLTVTAGTEVDFYPSYDDTTGRHIAYRGTILKANDYTSVVRLKQRIGRPTDSIWAYVAANLTTAAPVQIAFNTNFSGSPLFRKIFDEILSGLRRSPAAMYLAFTDKGGDLGIKHIELTSKDSVIVLLGNPVSGAIYREIKVGFNDGGPSIANIIGRYASWEYLYKIQNLVPETHVEFKMHYPSGGHIQQENGSNILYDGDSITIEFVNNNPYPVYYFIIDLQPDGVINLLPPERPIESFIPPGSTYSLSGNTVVTIAPPFGSERFKIITSLDMDFLQSGFIENLRNVSSGGMSFHTRGLAASGEFYPERLDIQNVDFEIRSRLYARNPAKAIRINPTISTAGAGGKMSYSLDNPSQDRFYFNVIKRLDDGSYATVLPNADYPAGQCRVDDGKSAAFNVTGAIHGYDQVFTVYADKPFNLQELARDAFLRELASGESPINDFLVDIIHYGRIPGTPFNRIGLDQQIYIPQKEGGTKGGDEVFIKMVTPKLTGEKGGTLSSVQQYIVNGFASIGQKRPVTKVELNGKAIPYDTVYKFFESPVELTGGVNSVVLEAADEKGFTATEKFDLLFNDNSSGDVSLAGKNYYLGVGINNYKTWPHLNNARYDVEKFGDLLKRKFGFDSANNTLLLDSSATRKNIINAIRSFLKKAGPNDNIVIYLSGHGNEDQLADGDYYFIPQDADASDVTTAVKSTDILDNFEKIKALHCILIIDACYAGEITNNMHSGNAAVLTSRTDVSPDRAPSKWIITAGRATKVSDGIPGQNSPFARILINYLKENNDEKTLTISKVIDYLKDNVPIAAPLQIPLGIEVDGQGEFTFRVKEALNR